MFGPLFNNLTEPEKNDAIESIIQHATPRHDFYLMLTLSVAMASFGILLRNSVILIGSMLIAPLLYPILALALGVIASDESLIMRSFSTILRSLAFALLASVVIGFLFSSHDPTVLYSYEASANAAQSSLLFVLVAAIAGFAAAFAMTKPYLNDTLPGVAIAVALVPPLSAAGIALSLFQWDAFSNALLIFMVNLFGIMFTAMIVFSLMRFSTKRTVTKEVVKAEEKMIKKEEKVAQKAVQGEVKENKTSEEKKESEKKEPAPAS